MAPVLNEQADPMFVSVRPGLAMDKNTDPMFVPLPPGLKDLLDARRCGNLGVQPCAVKCPTMQGEELYPQHLSEDGAGKSMSCARDLVLSVSQREVCVSSEVGAWTSDLWQSSSQVGTYGAWVCSKSGAAVQTDEPVNVRPASVLGADPTVPEFISLLGNWDDAEAEAALVPVLTNVLGKEMSRSEYGGACARWWTKPMLPLLCPLTKFPMCLLPYPPFKFRVDSKRSGPHQLVDGKFLAMNVIVTGELFACGRELQASDIIALDDYIRRCKLGPYRPGRAVELRRQAENGATPDLREQAAKELETCRSSARAELGKLRRIQENRLLQINKAMPVTPKGCSSPNVVSRHAARQPRERFSSCESSCSTSTRASTTGFADA